MKILMMMKIQKKYYLTVLMKSLEMMMMRKMMMIMMKTILKKQMKKWMKTHKMKIQNKNECTIYMCYKLTMLINNNLNLNEYIHTQSP